MQYATFEICIYAKTCNSGFFSCSRFHSAMPFACLTMNFISRIKASCFKFEVEETIGGSHCDAQNSMMSIRRMCNWNNISYYWQWPIIESNEIILRRIEQLELLHTHTLTFSFTSNNINICDWKRSEKNHFSLYSSIAFAIRIFYSNFYAKYCVQLQILSTWNTIQEKRMFGILSDSNNA